jgi:hypothetical protein
MDSDMEEATVEGPDLEVLVAPVGELGPEALVIEGNSAINTDDAKLVYDRTHFRKYKAYQRFKDDYRECRVAMERGLVVTDFDERAPCIWTMLEAQGWAVMVEDHRPAIAKLVREFYANLHRRVGDSFLT